VAFAVVDFGSLRDQVGFAILEIRVVFEHLIPWFAIEILVVEHLIPFLPLEYTEMVEKNLNGKH